MKRRLNRRQVLRRGVEACVGFFFSFPLLFFDVTAVGRRGPSRARVNRVHIDLPVFDSEMASVARKLLPELERPCMLHVVGTRGVVP